MGGRQGDVQGFRRLVVVRVDGRMERRDRLAEPGRDRRPRDVEEEAHRLSCLEQHGRARQRPRGRGQRVGSRATQQVPPAFDVAPRGPTSRGLIDPRPGEEPRTLPGRAQDAAARALERAEVAIADDDAAPLRRCVAELRHAAQSATIDDHPRALEELGQRGVLQHRRPRQALELGRAASRRAHRTRTPDCGLAKLAVARPPPRGAPPDDPDGNPGRKKTARALGDPKPVSPGRVDHRPPTEIEADRREVRILLLRGGRRRRQGSPSVVHPRQGSDGRSAARLPLGGVDGMVAPRARRLLRRHPHPERRPGRGRTEVDRGAGRLLRAAPRPQRRRRRDAPARCRVRGSRRSRAPRRR